VDGNSHVVSGQKFAGEMGSVIRFVVVMQQPVFDAKVRGEVFANFHVFTIQLPISEQN
jgi:hypothetical protein